MSRQWDALVIGAGPAGLRAASVIAESGLEVVLVDEQAFPGGQIYRHVTAPGAEERFAEAADYRDGTELVRCFRRSGADKGGDFYAVCIGNRAVRSRAFYGVETVGGYGLFLCR